MRYSSTLKASEWKTVCCEHCPGEYAYKVTREATGTGRSVLFLDNDGAKERARQEAEENIARALDKAVEPVWCPECGSYQADMFSTVRMNRVILWYFLAFLFVVGGLITSMFWGDTTFLENVAGGPGLVSGIAAAVIVALAFGYSTRIDPNADAKARIGTRDKIVPMMMRAEYEAEVERAVAQGKRREHLLALHWR
jgi:hypothetical protein